MEPTRDGPGALANVLDRLLDKGIILDLDLVIHLAGIPLIAINLRAAIASVETMIRYGIMEKEWIKGGQNADPDR